MHALYLRHMQPTPPPSPTDAPMPPQGLWDTSRLAPSKLQFAAVVGLAVIGGAMLMPFVRNPFYEILGETLFVSMVSLFAFNAASALRQTLVPRWITQWAAVMLGAALGPLIVQLMGTGGSLTAFTGSRPLVAGYFMVMFSAAISGSLLTLGALYRERDATAKAEALQFALERETLKRQADNARLTLLTAQIEPHFLLNTLANVQTLVETGSPQAVPVFRSLIAYLRGAMQQLQQESASLADEERLVRSYLDIMAMRMPDRLRFSIDIDPELKDLRFPPMALLTLVENAVRHGIDPSTEGGEIAIGARSVGIVGVLIWVSDTGVGMSETASSGVGLTNLQERLKAVFGPSATLELSEQSPHGLRVDLRFRKPQ
ncbi:MAG: sensor histidine kinase [Burkholderiales bacterium PBB4]|nr:MAG: sensor histidine kinase [Burkholderiales bacterium PBB4]